MKFEYGVTNGECVDKKKCGRQHLEKKTNDSPCAAQLVHGKDCVCRVPDPSTRQTQALPCVSRLLTANNDDWRWTLVWS
jgi:hypothetical protein